MKKNRQYELDFTNKIYESFTNGGFDLMKMLQKEPENRITAEEALSHSFTREIAESFDDENVGALL